jgi:hydroxymethylglutaryl-CoA synthase
MTELRGIVASGVYLPIRRLDRRSIAPVVGQGGGRGTRTVASFDEDTTTMAVEAARRTLRGSVVPDTVLFGTVVPGYTDRTNATAIHAALRLPGSCAAFDLGAATRSVNGGLRLALTGSGTHLVIGSDIRVGLPGSIDESAGGDAAAAAVIGPVASTDDVIASLLGIGSATDEFIERWRVPGESRSKAWDDKFAEVSYLPCGLAAWTDALAAAGMTAADVALVAVSAPTTRLASTMAGRLGGVQAIDDLAATVGQTGAAQPLVLLHALLAQSEPGQVVALVSLADGADVFVFRRGSAAVSSLDPLVNSGRPVPYGKYLSWRGMLSVEPPRRPEPQRVSASAAARNDDWKFGLVASRDRETGLVHMPPSRVSADGNRTDQMDAVPMADAVGTIATFTVDRMAYSPSPPVVFAVVDFDGGGRLPVELTDTDGSDLEPAGEGLPPNIRIGARVDMTFRRLFTADGIHNYFWKARLVRDEQAKETTHG